MKEVEPMDMEDEFNEESALNAFQAGQNYCDKIRGTIETEAVKYGEYKEDFWEGVWSRL